ncbi:MAG: hypothetical protein AABX17_03915 [Nanoarchaeota archaeon]
MENMVDFVNERVSGGFTYNESLSSMLRMMIQDTKKKPNVADYYIVTELCNPAQTYWARTSEKVEKPMVIQKKLNWGTTLHGITGKWLETFPDFVVNEGNIDGAWVDLPGVKGRIDCRIGDSIFDLKTKNEIPETAEEVISKYPQDVEQVCFYSAIHPSHDKINYLIFMKDSGTFPFKAFKIEIKDPSKIDSLIKTRIKTLDEAIKTKNPISLGRCRYHEKGCQFFEANLCNCDKLEPLSTEQLQQAINLTYDEEMTKRLLEVKTKYHASKNFFSTWNIISPRKYNLKEDGENDQEKKESQSFLGALVKKLPIKLSFGERKELFKSSLEPRLHVGYRWANTKSSGNQDSKIIPYIVKANMSNNIQTRPNEYYIAELGIVVANYGKTKGIIFIISPKKNNFIQAFEITYKNTNEILAKTKEIIVKLEKGEKDILSLPPCPFMNKTGVCSLKEECHSREGFGCIK